MGQITKTTAQINTLLDAVNTLSKTSVGLGNVDNTSDVNKPISTATQNALNAKADSSAVSSALSAKLDANLLPAAATDGEITAGTVTSTRTISPAQAKSSAKTFGIEKFANYAALPSPATFGVGVAQTSDTGELWISDSLKWTKINTIKPGRKIAIVGNSIVAQQYIITNNTGAYPAWAENTAKTIGNSVSPLTLDLSSGYANQYYYTCTGAGTTGSVEPIWPQNINEAVTDGTVIWSCTGKRSDMAYWGVSYFTLAQALSGQRLTEIYMAGLGGRKASTLLPYIDRAIDLNPDVMFFTNIFENDCGNTPTLAATNSAWLSVKSRMDKCLARGIKIIVSTVFPSAYIDASSAFTGYSFADGSKSWLWLNAKIKEYCGLNKEAILFDAAAVYLDPNYANPVFPENTSTFLSAAGTGQQLKFTDGIHPYTSANWKLAKKLAEVITLNFQPFDHFTNHLDPYSRSKNPLHYGNGTAGSGTITGTPSALWTLNAYGTGGAATITKPARTDISGNWVQIAYSATTADNLSFINTTYDFHNSNYVAGVTPFQVFFEVAVVANPTLLTLPQITVFSGITFQSWLSTGSTSQDIGQFITEDTVFTLKTIPHKIPDNMTSIGVAIQAYGRGAASFTAKIGRNTMINPAAIPALT